MPEGERKTDLNRIRIPPDFLYFCGAREGQELRSRAAPLLSQALQQAICRVPLGDTSLHNVQKQSRVGRQRDRRRLMSTG